MVVLENKIGRILAMAGGFSYPLSQLNRATHSSVDQAAFYQLKTMMQGVLARATAHSIALNDAVLVHLAEGQAKRRRGPSCGCALWFRARWWCWRTRPAAFSRWRADSPIRSVCTAARL